MFINNDKLLSVKQFPSYCYNFYLTKELTFYLFEFFQKLLKNVKFPYKMIHKIHLHRKNFNFANPSLLHLYFNSQFFEFKISYLY